MKRALIVLALISAVLTPGFSQPAKTPVSKPAPAAALAPITAEQRKEILDKVNEYLSQIAYVPGVDFSKWPTFLDAEMKNITAAQTPNQFSTAINRALENFAASHIVFSTPEAVTQMRGGSMVGLGIRPDKVADGVKILDVIPNSGASDAGLQADDVIIEIGGKKNPDLADLRGEDGSTAMLRVRSAKGGERVISVKRRKFSTVTPEGFEWLDAKKEVGRLYIPSFMTYNRKAVEKFMEDSKDAKLILLDLRGNGGGSVASLLHLAGYFLPADAKLGTWINRQSVNGFLAETKGDPKTPVDIRAVAAWSKQKVTPFSPKNGRFKGQVIALINGGSGSASEMMAAAVQEVLGTPVIGTKSAGKVLASLMLPLPENFQLQVPFQDYVTIKGVRLEGNGVTPNLVAPTPTKRGEKDEAIAMAMDWWKNRRSTAKSR